MNPKLTDHRLSRRAIVYVRQSSLGQVQHNKESQLRQYGLEKRARELGFQDVMVIDDDLGRSGSGLVERPGFQRLVAEVCCGDVGAIFCIEASRLARNGRDWHHLIEICGFVSTVVVDPDGIYDPSLMNDRLLLGLKGTMSEFELNLLRQRSVEAIRQKARRGELRILLPVGYCWSEQGHIEKDPNQRVQQSIELIFSKMIELGSARQVLLWFRNHRVELPNRGLKGTSGKVYWKPPIYNTILRTIKNPIYAGAYAYGKTFTRTTMEMGRPRKSAGHHRSRSEWTALIRDHHEGYISWEQFERNQGVLARNAHMKAKMSSNSARGGKALLAGMLRCARCGRMLHVTYSGTAGRVVRYHCRGAHVNHGEEMCISFGGLRVDGEVAMNVLRVIRGDAVDAAIQTTQKLLEDRRNARGSMELELQQAHYETQLEARRYDAVDPENRLVASELEKRWNRALRRERQIESRLKAFDQASDGVVIPDQSLLLSLADNLPKVWDAPTTDMRLKQRIIRILIKEIIADVDDERHQIVLILHWSGGRHSELGIRKNKTGRHGKCTDKTAIEIVRQMAMSFSDEQIASTLNRLNIRTGAGNTWNEKRVYSLRYHHRMPAYQENDRYVTMQDAAQRLRVSASTIRRFIKREILPAKQVVPCAPWQIATTDLDREQVLKAVHAIKGEKPAPRAHDPKDQLPLFTDS